jgi:hypothetical protein
MAHVREALDLQNSLIRSTQQPQMSHTMKTKRFLSSLCAAAYPLVTLAATLAAALCISTPVLS